MNLDIHWNQNDPEIQNQNIYTTYHDNQHLQQQLLDHHRPVENGKISSTGKSRFGSMKRATEGEIVQVQGGHILRATGRKDRHSKVYTAKGPRDRRVRLSAHTAIQFYDVQDRLGYDRPSKAVDWLIKKAKNAIDKLDELPPWDPNEDTTNSMSASMEQNQNSNPSGVGLEHEQQQGPQGPQSESDSRYAFQVQRQLEENANANSSYMMTNPATTETTQSIADTLKSFFPMNSGTSLMNFQNYPHDIMPRSSIQTEDLGLSLHSTLHDQNSNHRASNSSDHHHQALFTSPNTVSFEANYPRIAGWILPQQPFFSQNAAFHQREPLQSNYSHLIHAWEERPMTVAETSMSNNHFNAGFQVPARIHGEQEHGHGVVSIKPSSDSPNSRH